MIHIQRHIAAAFVIVGLICIARGVLGAEMPKPFAWALVRNGEVRWLFHERTACDLDLVSASMIAPKGTRLSCERRK